MKSKVYRIIHIVLTGILTIPIALYMSAGAMGEYGTDSYFVEPVFLLLIAIWAVGSVLSFLKKFGKYGLIISALPTLLIVGTFLFSMIIAFS